MVKCSQCQQNAHILQYRKYYCAKCFLIIQKNEKKEKK
tara:strand:+ start:820 stop:933 length:114 start_codon:yes stop_codon:yes gene_type:complete